MRQLIQVKAKHSQVHESQLCSITGGTQDKHYLCRSMCALSSHPPQEQEVHIALIDHQITLADAERGLYALYKILQFCSHHEMHTRDILKILLNRNLQMFNVWTTIYQIAQSLILKTIFCCNITFYNSPSLIKLLTKTILVNWMLPKVKASSQ